MISARESLSETQVGQAEHFVDAFKRAIRQEMEAMRDRMGPFEVPLVSGEGSGGETDSEGCRCSYQVIGRDDKLVPGMDCSLRSEGGECVVQVESFDGVRVVLTSPQSMPLLEAGATLVIYPWFLYEKLLESLEALLEGGFYLGRALKLFGKEAALSRPRPLLRAHEGLNDSQLEAVRLCSDNDVAFVWGPPGTGKTTTLAHIVDEFVAQKKRVLVLSTTNAAVDQALEQIAGRPELKREFAEGRVVRLGRSEGPSFGAELREAAERLNGEQRELLVDLNARAGAYRPIAGKCVQALACLSEQAEPRQQSLFAEENRQLILPPDLEGIFAAPRIAAILDKTVVEQMRMLERRLGRLRSALDAIGRRISRARGALLQKEFAVMNQAGVVLSTLTNGYFSPHMNGQRFDAVVVEEASMAVLPNLFYAACLGKEKTIMVGDPRQLPPITQSDAPLVHKAMGRNIFEVAVPNPLDSDVVALLDVQYRMHPKIGDLVSRMFYAGRLRHGGGMKRREEIAARAPYPGQPLIVFDTAGKSKCALGPGGRSRVNNETAEICVDLARQAVAAGAGSVAIVTPYVDQSRAIRKLLGPDGENEKIECSTVHRFQGHERDVVILDTVDADPMRPGILLSSARADSSAPNLINVAISRARGKLIIVADAAYFQKNAFGSVMTRTIERAFLTGSRVSL